MLPNTAGCRSVREAVTTAQLARELFGTPWIKLEVIGDDETLQPDVVGLVEAAAILVKDGFEVFAYCTEDLTVALRLRDAGCRVIMPWAAPIGSARGILNRDALRLLRARLPDVTLVVDAGLGAPSHAADALELGYDAVLLNTAIAKAADPVGMARAFRLAVEAGRLAYEVRADGPARFRLSLDPRRRDTVLACRILIASIPSSTASPGSRGLPRSASARSSCARRTCRMRRRLAMVRAALAATAGTRAQSSSSTIGGARRSRPAPQHVHLGQEDLAEADVPRSAAPD